jgi:hypothetical protein
MNEYGALKPALRRRKGKKENNGGDKPNWGTLSTYMEIS